MSDCGYQTLKSGDADAARHPDPRYTRRPLARRLSQQIDRRHALVLLADLIDWAVFEVRFGPARDATRLMVGSATCSTPLAFRIRRCRETVATIARNAPRLRRRRLNREKTVSTVFSHEHEVGVKWKSKRGCRLSQRMSLGCFVGSVSCRG
jgi:hypothetical protein